MLALHEIIRDAGQNLATLSDDDFIEGLTKALADLLTAFHVGRATIRDAKGTRVGPVIVVATSPIRDGEIETDAVAVAAFAGGVLLERASQSGVGGITRQRLELGLILVAEADGEVPHARHRQPVCGQLLRRQCETRKRDRGAGDRGT